MLSRKIVSDNRYFTQCIVTGIDMGEDDRIRGGRVSESPRQLNGVVAFNLAAGLLSPGPGAVKRQV